MGRITNDSEVAFGNAYFDNLLPTGHAQAALLNRMTGMENFGESGKNFIEIGKRPKRPEIMLRLVVP